MRRVVSAVVMAVFASVMASAASAKVLTFCSQASPEGFDPAPFVADATFDAAEAIYDRLMEFAPGTATVVPGLAESFEVSDDGLTYTFHIRPGVTFHTTPYFTPTRDLNADDFVFSLARQLDPKQAYFGYMGGQWPYATGLSLDARIKSIKKVDDLTVEIAIGQPDGSLPATLAMDFAAILSKEYADALLKAKTPALLNQQPVGTGPYSFAGYAPDVRVGFRSNPAYWRGAPKVDLLVFSITPAPAERLRKLQIGECHVMADPDAAALRAAAGDEGLEIAEADRLDVAYLAFNTRKAPFGDVRVRRALGMAIDKQAIVDAVYGGAASAANTVLPPSIWAYDGTQADATFDIDAAKQLLAAAGVKDLKLTLMTIRAGRPYDPNPVRVANMIAADFARIGVEATVTAPDMLSDFLRRSADPDRDGAVLLGWTSDNGDPDDFLSLLLSCEAVGASNRAQWCNAPFNDLIADAKAASDPAVRARLYSEAQKMLAVHQPLTAIAHTVVSVPMAASVTGFKASPLGRYDFSVVDIAK